jgi:hypothetical protein
MGTSMQTGVGLPGTSAKAAAKVRCFGTICVLLLGLAVSACVGTGQIPNLAETARPSVAFESIDGAPAAVVPRFVTILKEEAVQQRIAVGSPAEVNYRLQGYLAARNDDGTAASTSPNTPADATAIAWTLDVYDGDQHRLIRLSGEEKVAGRLWASADDQALRRIARAGMDQLAAFLATRRTPSAGAAAPSRTASRAGWLDDWAPEASGIFRIFGRAPSTPAAVAEAKVHAAADDVALPRGRPAVAGAPSGGAMNLATANPAENAR